MLKDLKEIKPLTLQEAFSIIWGYFVLEKHPRSINSRGDCVYKNKNNDKCAIGCLIPDDLYFRYLEDKSIPILLDPKQGRYSENSISKLNKIRKLFSDIHPYDLRSLQVIHDHSNSSNIMEMRLKDFAKTKGLDINRPLK